MIGPASESPEVMKRMLGAGMMVARLNFSHCAFEGHRRVIRNLRIALQARHGLSDGYHGGLASPKMRIGMLQCPVLGDPNG